MPHTPLASMLCMLVVLCTTYTEAKTQLLNYICSLETSRAIYMPWLPILKTFLLHCYRAQNKHLKLDGHLFNYEHYYRLSMASPIGNVQ